MWTEWVFSCSSTTISYKMAWLLKCSMSQSSLNHSSVKCMNLLVAPFIISHIKRYMNKNESQKNQYMTNMIMHIAKYVSKNLSNDLVVDLDCFFTTSWIFHTITQRNFNGVISIVKYESADNFLANVILMLTISQHIRWQHQTILHSKQQSTKSMMKKHLSKSLWEIYNSLNVLQLQAYH